MDVKSSHGEEHKGEYFAYVRVSTDKQDTERQRKEILDWLNGGDHTIKWYEDNAVSGSVHPSQRDGLQKCIRDAKRAKGTIIIADLDRFSRTMWQTLQFFDQVVSRGKCNLVVVSDPLISEDGLALQMRAMIAQHEREKIRNRTKSKLDYIKSQLGRDGYYVTQEGHKITKLGSDDKSLEKARVEATKIVNAQADKFADKMRPLITHYLKEGMSYRAIAHALNERNEPTRRGGEWFPSTVSNLIKRLGL